MIDELEEFVIKFECKVSKHVIRVIKEEIARLQKGIDVVWGMPINQKLEEDKLFKITDFPIKKIECMHQMCHRCGGTGIDNVIGGSCVHAISCPCPNCNGRSL